MAAPTHCDPRTPEGIPPTSVPGHVLLISCDLYTPFVCGTALLDWSGFSGLWFVLQVVLLAAVLCAVLFVAERAPGADRPVIRIVLQIVLFVVAIVGFGVSIFGKSAWIILVVYAAPLVLLLEVGGYGVRWYLGHTLRGLSGSAVEPYMQSAATAVDKMFRREAVMYVAVPLGLFVGTIVGLFRRQSPQEIVGLCLLIILSLASAILLWFLILASRRMFAPLLKRRDLPSPAIEEVPLTETSEWSGTVLRVSAPNTPAETDDQGKQDFDLASVATRLRKIYLFDALHNSILIMAFAAVILSLLSITVGATVFVVVAMGGALVFTQLPFMFGQQRLRLQLLKDYRNSERVDRNEKLKPYAPLFPSFEFITTLISSPTAGGAVYFLCANLFDKLRL
jgi:hypothetical protein